MRSAKKHASMILLHNVVKYIAKLPLLYLPLLLVAMIVFSHYALAKDFGVEGHTFPIIEEDILKVIGKKLANIDIAKFNKKIQNKTKEYIERPTPVSGIKKATENREFYFDPTYNVPDNIYDHNNNLLHEAGKTINPLEQTSLTEALIFIDGDDDTQVKLALDLRSKKQDTLKIILVKGSPLKLQRQQSLRPVQQNIWIYFDQAGFITTKLGITEVPALVEQEGLKLKITIMGDRNA
jgi:conjugal transfer pilus assembly protein TraW